MLRTLPSTTEPVRIFLGHAFPGVFLDLLHAEGDFLLVLVDLEDFDLDLLALGDDFAGMVDALGPGHLGDVDEAFDAFLKLAERAVGHDVDDFGFVDGADGVFLLDIFPRAGVVLLEAEGDLFLFLVDREDFDFEFLIDLEHVAGMIDAAPAHVGDVQQAVDTAEVDEGAEVGDVLDGALADFADGQAVEGLALQLLALLLDHLAAGDDDVAAFFVDLEDDGVDGPADPIGDFAGPADVHLAGGEEDRHADVDEQPAFDFLGDFAGDGVSLLLGLHDRFPIDDAISFAFGDFDQAGVTLDVFEEDADFVADLDVFGFVEFGAFENAFALEAEFDDEIVADDAGDFSLENGARGEVLDFVAGDEFGEIVGGVAECGGYGAVGFCVHVSE